MFQKEKQCFFELYLSNEVFYIFLLCLFILNKTNYILQKIIRYLTDFILLTVKD